MTSFKKIQDSVSGDLERLNKIIGDTLKSSSPLMQQVVDNFLASKGKQLRPILVILSGQLFSNGTAVSDNVIYAGAAIELLHNASLIHDDVIDKADMRRKTPTPFKKYGAKLFDTYNEAYAPLDGFVPVDEQTEKNVLKQFGTVINKRYISVLVDEKEEVAAFGIVLPSLVKSLVKHRGKLFPTGFIDVLISIKKPKELEMALIGVKQEYKNTGINALVMARIMHNVIEDGIEAIESNPMLETNYSIQQQWKFAENEIVKRRQTYKKRIGSLIGGYAEEEADKAE